MKEIEVTVETLKEELEREEYVGRFGRIRRRDKKAKGVEGEKGEGKKGKGGMVKVEGEEEWDPVGMAPKRMGRFVLIEGGGKEKGEGQEDNGQ